MVVASITPGALPVEIAASIGRRKFGIRGMIAGAVMMALPGALMTVALVAVLEVILRWMQQILRWWMMK